MARVLNGFLGDAIGKLGNVVFRKWNSLITVSQYQPNVTNPDTPKQKVQRTKIKFLSLALLPFKDSIIPLNFKNRRGLSTSWAEAIKANYPLIDDLGNIAFKDMILSGGSLMPPAIIDAFYDPFINILTVNYNLINHDSLCLEKVRISGAGKMIPNNDFNTANFCKLCNNTSFSTYINELVLPDYPLNFSFDNAWSEGMLFYHLVRSADLDLRAYNPRSIINTPSAGAFFSVQEFMPLLDFSFNDCILTPDHFHVTVTHVANVFNLRVSIDQFPSIPGLDPSDQIFFMFRIIDQETHNYNNRYSFSAAQGQFEINIQPNEQNKPYLFLYYVADTSYNMKSAVTRYAFNLPQNISYCEMLFSNDYIHPENIKITKPYTAIWGDLKEIMPLELIGVAPYQITSKNIATGETKLHSLNSDNIFLCSKLLRNQIYKISISDGETPVYEFSVLGLDNEYCMTGEASTDPKLIKFRAESDLTVKIK